MKQRILMYLKAQMEDPKMAMAVALVAYMVAILSLVMHRVI